MFQLYGNKICMLAPERFDHMPFLISKLQRGVFEMHQSTLTNMCVPDWKLGLVCTVNKFPWDHDTHSELIQLGSCVSWQDFLHIGLWGFMDNLVVTKPSKPMQLGLGYNEPKPVQAQR